MNEAGYLNQLADAFTSYGANGQPINRGFNPVVFCQDLSYNDRQWVKRRVMHLTGGKGALQSHWQQAMDELEALKDLDSEKNMKEFWEDEMGLVREWGELAE